MDPGVLFGLGSAGAFGGGDFAGGVASRRVSGLTVAGGAQVVGLALLLILLAFTHPALPSQGAMALAAVAGALGGIGLVALFRGLSLGSMGIVSALSGVGSVSVPLLVGAVIGRAPVSGVQWFGVLVAMVATGAASGATRRGVNPQAVGLGIVAALFFGLWFLLLDLAADEGLIWALVASRAGAAVLIGGAALVWRRYDGLRAAWPIVVLAGTGDVAGNAGFVLARDTLPVGVAAALAGMYPIVTMLLARAVLRESLPRLGVAAVLLAVVGVCLISLG
jgi:drug/metabolite transporter (DMT)-like permease